MAAPINIAVFVGVLAFILGLGYIKQQEYESLGKVVISPQEPPQVHEEVELVETKNVCEAKIYYPGKCTYGCYGEYKPCDYPDIYRLIDKSGIQAIGCILANCPERLAKPSEGDYKDIPLYHALSKGEFDIALSIAINPMPLWGPQDDFGIHSVYLALKLEQYEILEHIFNHSSCLLDKHTYCNKDIAILIQFSNIYNDVTAQIRIAVQHHKERLRLEQQKYYEALKSVTGKEREELYTKRCEKTELCFPFCSKPGTCIVSSISFE
jgi:hypothetical protein